MMKLSLFIIGSILGLAEATNLRPSDANTETKEDSIHRHLAETRSVLWVADGEPWVSGSGTLLGNFTNVGYMSGNVPIPDWPLGVSITDYGAVADDLISDVQALRDAVADCPPFHAVLIPNGRYIIDQPIVFDSTYNNFVLRGESRDGAILFFPHHMHEIEQTAESST